MEVKNNEDVGDNNKLLLLFYYYSCVFYFKRTTIKLYQVIAVEIRSQSDPQYFIGYEGSEFCPVPSGLQSKNEYMVHIPYIYICVLMNNIYYITAVVDL